MLNFIYNFRLQSDHNEDNSIEILEKWLLRTEPLYHSVRFQYDKSKKRRVNETSIVDWPVERYIDLIQMKEESLEAARKMWADYVFVSSKFFLLVILSNFEDSAFALIFIENLQTLNALTFFNLKHISDNYC